MTAVSHYIEGIRLYRKGRYAQAVEQFGPATSESGLMGQLARYYQGQACRQAGMALARADEFEVAQEYLRRTIKLIGPTADLAAYLAKIYTRMGRHDRAEAQLDAASAREDSPAMRSALAISQYRNGRTAMAIMTLRDALHKHDGSAELHLQMGLMLAREDRVGEAREHLARAIELDCLNAEAHYYLAMCDAAEGRFAQAARQLDRARSLQPHDVMVAHQLAVVARAAAEQGQPVRLTLRELSAPHAQTHIQRLADLVATEHDFVMAFLALPESRADAELFELLSAVLATALEVHPNYPDLHYRQALVCVRLGQAERAIEHAGAAVELNGRYIQARILLGKLLAEAKPELAVGHLSKAIRAGGDFADVHHALGGAYERLGRIAEARCELEHALRINDNYTEAREALNRLAA